MKPILDLCKLNESEAHGQSSVPICEKGQLVHVPILKAHRKCIRFTFMGVAYEYQFLPFDYAVAPHTLLKCVEVALEPFRHQVKRILFYLDNHDGNRTRFSFGLRHQQGEVFSFSLSSAGLFGNFPRLPFVAKCCPVDESESESVGSVFSRAGGTVAGPRQVRRTVTGSWIGSPPALSVGTVAGLATERLILQGKGLPAAVINTIQCPCAVHFFPLCDEVGCFLQVVRKQWRYPLIVSGGRHA